MEMPRIRNSSVNTAEPKPDTLTTKTTAPSSKTSTADSLESQKRPQAPDAGAAASADVERAPFCKFPNPDVAVTSLKNLAGAAQGDAAAILKKSADAAQKTRAGTIIQVRLGQGAEPPDGEMTGMLARELRNDRNGRQQVRVIFKPDPGQGGPGAGHPRPIEMDAAAFAGVPNNASVTISPSGDVGVSVNVANSLPLANMIGTVQKDGDQLVLVARNPLSPIQKLPLPGADAKLVGKTIIADLCSPLSASRYGLVHDLVDTTDPLEVRYAEVAIESGIPATFPAEVQRQVEEIEKTAKLEPKDGVKDLRAKTFLSTDNPGSDSDTVSKDRDQAFSVEPRPQGGHIFYYAIADVRALVPEGSPVDQYAERKMVTTYLPGFDLPAMPRELCEDLMSLNEGVSRSAVILQMSIDKDGKVVEDETQAYRAIIQNSWGGSYRAAQQYYDGKSVPGLGDPQKHELDLVSAMAHNLDTQAVKRGMVTDRQDGRYWSERITELLSVTANSEVGRLLDTAGVPTVNRFHPPAKAQKLDAFARMSQALGHAWDPHQGALSEYLAKLDPKDPVSASLAALAMRTNERAVMSTTDQGHTGLALQHYAWSTAPMRRYPDTAVLQQVLALCAKKSDPSIELPITAKRAQQIVDRDNMLDNVQRKIDNEIGNIQTAKALESHVGHSLPVHVYMVAPAGVTFKCEDPRVEVFVPTRRISGATGQRLELDGEGTSLTGGGVTFRDGDEAKLTIRSVKVEAGEVDAMPAGMERHGQTQSPNPNQSQGHDQSQSQRPSSHHHQFQHHR